MTELTSSARPRLDSRREHRLRWAMRLVERLGLYWTLLIIATPVWAVTNLVVKTGNSTGSVPTTGMAGRRTFD